MKFFKNFWGKKKIMRYPRPSKKFENFSKFIPKKESMEINLRILDSADEKAPFLIVGYSMGTFAARLFSARRTADTCGFIMVPSVAKKNEKNDLSIVDRSIVRSIAWLIDRSNANFKFQLARAGAGRLGLTERHGGAPALAN